MSKHFILGFLFLCSICFSAFSQNNRIAVLQKKLDSLSYSLPVLNDSISISVTNVSVQDFLRGIAIANNVNMSIANDLNQSIVNNFNNVQFKDILLYLIKEYDLDIEIMGNIIIVKKYIVQTPPPPKFEPKPIAITKNENDLYTIDLKNDTLQYVIRELAKLSGSNIIARTDIRDNKISGFVQEQPLRTVLESIALSNDLLFEIAQGNYIFSSQTTASSTRQTQRSGRTSPIMSDEKDYIFNFSLRNAHAHIISIEAKQAPLDTVISTISKALNLNFHKLSELEGSVTLIADSISYENLLKLVFKGTKYSFRDLRGVYLLGEEQTSGMHITKLIPLEYRTVDKLKAVFPRKIQEGLEVIEFVELNSLLVTGTPELVLEFEQFIYSIDKTVPVVLIEVIIIDVLKTHTITTGINAGRGAPAQESTGTFMPGVDITLDANFLNRLLNSFNGYGWFSIGQVSHDFYLQLQALEENGIIKVRSTPKLSTLNGHEASLSSGETRYYLEEQSSTISSTAIQQTNTRQYKSVNADLTIQIKPIVSGNGQITLEIEVSQSDFKGSEIAGAPPNSINRKFKSLIRVQDGEMVLLGGLERNENSTTGKGTPVLSRIPIVKWLFSSRKKNKSNSKLDIFIKPTVIY